MARNIVARLWFPALASLLLSGCQLYGTSDNKDTNDAEDEDDENNSVDDNSSNSDANTTDSNSSDSAFVPDPVPELDTVATDDNAAIYFNMFTHTEDPFNHTLSEARYTRIGAAIEDLAADYPDAGVFWTIHFQGSDAATVAARTSSTGIVKLLTDLRDGSLVAFAYHGAHEPTYTTRPQNLLDANSTWEERVDAIKTFVSCEKNATIGGCIADTGGGIDAVQDAFGEVEVVSGIELGDGAISFEEGAGRHAIASVAPDRLVGFGLSDHGAGASDTALKEELMALLTPSIETSGTVFWMDDTIRINDGDRLNDIGAINTVDGLAAAEARIALIDRTRRHIFNTPIASKYIYCAASTSPTSYGYAHPDAPELPSILRNSLAQIEANYDATIDTMNYLAADIISANPGSQFLSPSGVIEKVAPADYWEVTSAELDVAARWLILNWDGRPPNFASDGVEFYSLRDMMGLLARALGPPIGLPGNLELKIWYGPLATVASAGAVTVSEADLRSIATAIQTQIATVEAWQETPTAMMASSFATTGAALNAAQALYGLAYLYAATYAGVSAANVAIPDSEAMPETFAIIEDLECLTCTDTAWSLKPARLR